MKKAIYEGDDKPPTPQRKRFAINLTEKLDMEFDQGKVDNDQMIAKATKKPRRGRDHKRKAAEHKLIAELPSLTFLREKYKDVVKGPTRNNKGSDEVKSNRTTIVELAIEEENI